MDPMIGLWRIFMLLDWGKRQVIFSYGEDEYTTTTVPFFLLPSWKMAKKVPSVRVR